MSRGDRSPGPEVTDLLNVVRRTAAGSRCGRRHVEQVNYGGERFWICVTGNETTPRQGWKLHISSDVTCATETLERALGVLLEDSCDFKVTGSLAVLDFLNSGRGGPAQVGKFITVYPHDDDACVRLALALDRATFGLSGPPVLSDRELRPGSRVSYRYGAFTGELDMQTPVGEVRSALLDPENRLVPDLRGEKFTPPAWAADPFEARGLAGPAPAPSSLVAGRYVPVGEVHRSPSTVVELAVDLDRDRRCILKRARRGALTDSSGSDAAARLQHEAALLRRLPASVASPEVFDLVETEREIILVMSDVPSTTLEHRVSVLQQQGQLPPPDLVRQWAGSLAELLAALHARGIVHRDLKPSNIIVDDDERAHLIDFNAARDVRDASPASLVSAGTPGYMSPQQTAGARAAVTDDVYGFGAVLYYLLTGAQPAQTPHAPTPLVRPVTTLRPGVSPPLARLTERCLNPDAGLRFTLAEIEAALGRQEPDAEQAPPVQAGPRPASGRQARCRQLAAELADTLKAMAVMAPHPDSVAWLTTHSSGRGFRSRDLGMGTAGALLAMAELAAAFPGQPGWPDLVARGARWLCVAPAPGGEPVPGLYAGEAGIGTALLRAGQVLRDQQVIEAAVRRGRTVASLPHRSPDMYNGTAGRLRFHLLLYQVTGEREALEQATQAASVLASAAEAGPDGTCAWRIPPGYGDMSGEVFLGYAHGTAGIADALLDFTQVTGDGRHLDAITGAARALMAEAAEVLADRSGLGWPVRPGLPPSGPFWCHGSAGVGKLFLRLATCGLVDDAASVAARAARATSLGGRAIGPTQCHGLAGGIEFLLDAYQATGDADRLRDAEVLGELLEAFSFVRSGHRVWNSDNPALVTPDYTIGMSGVAMTLLRLAEPERRPHQLSLAGFAYQA